MKKDRLPEEYLNEMRDLLGPEYSSYLSSLEERPCSGLRVNTLKAAPEQIAGHFGLTERVPWNDCGFYISGESRFTKHPYYSAGLYYIQEPSAMISAASLGTCPGERILDLCAAPGGKTTQIGAELKGSGILIANDLSASRAKALLKNIELMGIRNACVTAEDSGRLRQEFPLWFDRILVDAPCSGLGTLRRHQEIRWRVTPEHIDELAETGLALLKSAANHVEIGGQIVYATCTVTYAENNGVVKAFLESEEGSSFKLAPINGKAAFVSQITTDSPDAHFAVKFVRKS